jgi:AAA family ATP:ADP antiporter
MIDDALGHGGVMLMAAALLVLPWLMCRTVERAVPDGSRSVIASVPVDCPYPLREGFHIVWRNRYLALIALFVLLLNLVNTNGEYILASFVTERAADLSDADAYITHFYSGYFFITTTLGFLIQLFLVSRIFSAIGITGALFILPLVLVFSYGVLWALPLLAVARGAMVLENSLSYSLQTTTRHALFLPVTREEKYIAKNTIDTFFFRVGDVLSGGFIYLVAGLLGVGVLGFIQANIVFAAVMFLAVWAISQRHRGVVRENLKNAPPILFAPLGDLMIPAGKVTHLQLRADTFIDPDLGDALRYEARAHGGGCLPDWVRFDALTRNFQFNPPSGSAGSLHIRVVARDYDGLHTEASFRVDYGQGCGSDYS